MERTTIMIPESLKSKATKLAHERGISFSELVRKSLEIEIEAKHKGLRDPLFSDTNFFDKKSPKDASIHHDKYLYEKKP